MEGGTLQLIEKTRRRRKFRENQRRFWTSKKKCSEPRGWVPRGGGKNNPRHGSKGKAKKFVGGTTIGAGVNGTQGVKMEGRRGLLKKRKKRRGPTGGLPLVLTNRFPTQLEATLGREKTVFRTSKICWGQQSRRTNQKTPRHG